MVGRLFKTGECRKYEFYDILIKEMKDAGWEDMSSNYATDFNVMRSKGENGDKNLIVQLRPWFLTNEATSSVKTTNHSCLGVRFPIGYTEGATGVAGTFTRNATAWIPAYIFPASTATTGASAYDKDVLINYAIAVNKDNVICILTPPTATLLNSITIFIGYPDEAYTAENDSYGCIFASNYWSAFTVQSGTTAPTTNQIIVANKCSEIGTMDTDVSGRSIKCSLASQNPNSANLYVITDMVYENTSEGIRGKINSILFLPNVNILSNDIIMDGTNKYKVAINQATNTYTATSFPSVAIAFRIE